MSTSLETVADTQIACPDELRERVASNVARIVNLTREGITKAAEALGTKSADFIKMYEELADGVRSRSVQVFVNPTQRLARVVLPQQFIKGQPHMIISL